MLILSTITFTGCSRDEFGKEMLCTKLYSSYTAKADFLVSDGQKNTSGKADISKSQTTSITFTEPDFFKGITVKSDATGKEDTFIFEFSGIPASVPKSITSDISLIFSLFSDELPTKIRSLGSDNFRAYASSVENKNICEVFFEENGVSYSIIYNKQSGIPVSIDAGNDTLSVSIVLSDINFTQQ